MNCTYCQQPANYSLKNGAPCCTPSSASCPENRRRNSVATKAAYANGVRDTKHLDGKRGWRKGRTTLNDPRLLASAQRLRATTDTECFCVDSKVKRSSVKRRLQEDSSVEYKCRKCEVGGEWQGEKLVLQLEHKNGVNNDNRKENLEWLCPNCHSQSETYCGRNVKLKRLKRMKI